MKKIILLLFLLFVFANNLLAQNVGDYRSASSGVWSTAATWQTWNGTAWVGASFAPFTPSNVKILNGHTITISTSGVNCADLVVDVGGKLFTNSFTNLYVNVYGDTIMCNGTIGNGAIFDGISFNIDGANCRILGSSGSFDASRIRKNFATNPTTNLSIERDVNLKYCGGRQTQIYNNANSTAGTTGTRFNVTVAAGATLMLDSTVSAECQSVGSSTTMSLNCGTISGNVNVTTLTTAGITVGMMVSGSGIIPGTTIASIVSGTQFTLSQNALVTNAANNLTIGGNQITNTTAITSYYGATFAVPGSLPNCRVYGTGIAPGAYVVSATLVLGSIYNMQLSLPNIGPVSGTIYFVSDGNAAVDGVYGTGTGSSAGSFTINGTMVVSGTLYLTTNNTSTAVDSSVIWTVNNGGLLKVGNIATAASGASKHTLRVATGGKLEVFGLPGFYSALNATNNIYDIQAGSFTEFSGKGDQNVPVILSTAPSSGYYGNLKISGYGTKSQLATTSYSVFNNFEISNTTGAPKFNGSVSSNFFVGGNWTNYHDSAYIEANSVAFNRIGISTIYCPSGEVFNSLRYLKTDSSEVKFLSNINCKTQLSIATNGRFNLNGNTLTILSNLNTGITTVTSSTARYIYGETGDFNSKVKWIIGTTAVNARYSIPFAKGTGTANSTPFSFSVDANVQVDTLTVSTYSTPSSNLPLPPTVTNISSTNNLSNNNSDAMVDRYWYVGMSSPNVNNDTIVVSYGANELPLAPYNDANNIQAQPWSNSLSKWTLPLLGYASSNAVIIPNPPTNSTWALVNNSQPLNSSPTINVDSVGVVNCTGGNNGFINISITSGSAPYTYLWNDGVTTEDRTNLSVGTYTLIVTGSNGFQSNKIIDVTLSANQPTVVLDSVINTTCTTGNTGKLYVSVIGNNSPYTYQWSNGSVLEDPINLSAGTYTVTVSGCNGLSTSTSFVVANSNADLSFLSPIISNVSCYGGNNGAISINVTGDTAMVTNAGLLISELHSDPSGNDSPFEWVELIATKDITFSTTPYTVVFANNGSATTKGWMQGGSAALPPANSTYAFLIDSGSVTKGEVVYVGGSLMTPSGKKLRIKNTSTENGDGGIGLANLLTGVLGNGGGIADGIAVFNKPVSQLDSNSVPVDAILFGSGIGAAALADTSKGFVLPNNDRYSGGHINSSSFIAPDILGKYSLEATGNYNSSTGLFTVPRTWSTTNAAAVSSVSKINLSSVNYSWSNGATTKNLTGLTAGSYTLTATSTSGCSITNTYSVTQPDSLNINFNTTNTTCSNLSNGNIVANVSGGTAPYSYQWSNSAVATSITNLIAGVYTLTVTDANGCTKLSSTTLTSPVNINISESILNVNCNGSSTGSIALNVSGGAGGYTYFWSNGATTSSVNALAAGTYTVTVKDANNCTQVKSFNVTQLTAISGSFTKTNVSCFGGSNGLLTINVSGGTAPYTYVWGIGTTTATINNLVAGTYTVTVYDALGCSNTFTSTITQPNQLVISPTVTNVSCNGGTNGSITIAMVGGVSPYTYLWSNGKTTANNSNIITGVYTLTVTDISSCSTQSSITVTQPSVLDVLLTANGPICNGSTTGTITSIVSGGTSPYTYLWSNASTSQNLSGVAAGTYAVTVTDSKGCSLTQSKSISQQNAILITSVNPSGNNINYPVTIKGNNFTGVNSVRFNGVLSNSYAVNSDSSISVVVPNGATTGPLLLSNANGCSGQSVFNFNVITNFSSLNLKLFIEGFYLSNQAMDVPLVNSGLSGNASSTDSIEVLLYDTNDLYSPLERKKSLLSSSGYVEFSFPGYLTGGSYWISIKTRNALETWSKTAIPFYENTYYNFGGIKQFPKVQTSSIQEINSVSASSGGVILSDGGDSIIAKGICWSTNPNPTIALTTKTVQGGGSGNFSSTMNGLTGNTTYYVRAYATNSVGTAYGNQLKFVKNAIFQIADIDGNLYDTVTIGNQTWMKQNLKVSKYRNGDIIPNGLSDSLWSTTTNGAISVYNNSIINDSVYGKLYNGYAVEDPRGLCPVNWHIPSQIEWQSLELFLGGNIIAGGAMKESGFSHWVSPNYGANNSSGFTGLPGGGRSFNGSYSSIGYNGNWYSSTKVTSTTAIGFWLSSITNISYQNSGNKNFGFSVRCIKDRLSNINTTSVSTLSNNSATCVGNITSAGGDTVTARGVVWSTNPNPTIALTTKTTNGGGIGSFTASITGLTTSTTYYVRAYATNISGTAYGNEISFTTTNLPADIDGNIYDTVVVGSQTWLKQDLKVSRYRNGDAIPQITNSTTWGNLTSGAFCWYNNDSITYNAVYGKLYNWYVIADSRGICPVGWHVPTPSQFSQTINYLGGGTVAGGAMKEAGTSHWNSPNVATNSSRFTGLPCGERFTNFSGIGQLNWWWIFNPLDLTNGEALGVINGDANFYGFSNPSNKTAGWSIRCVKD